MKRIYLISIIVVFIDQLIKGLVHIYVDSSISLIGDFFKLTYVENIGAAFSILKGNTLFLIVVALIALNLIYFFFLKNRKNTKLEDITYGLLIGGILGNLIDRVSHGYVIDYLDFSLFNFPVFNLADICIVIGIAIILIDIVKEGIYENRSKRK